MVLNANMDPSQIPPQPLTPRQSQAMPADAENEESVVGPVASTNSTFPSFPEGLKTADDVFLTRKSHAVGEDDETEGKMGNSDKSPTVGPFSDGISRSGFIVEGQKTTGMAAEDE